MATSKQLINQFITELKENPHILDYARNFGNAIVAGKANHCAATMSAMLIFAGIYPTGIGTGHSNLEPWVPALVDDLIHKQGSDDWVKISLGQQIQVGDIGVVMTDTDVHHIYLIIDATDQAAPTIADNQRISFHQRPVAGDPAQSFSPTSFFLRAS